MHLNYFYILQEFCNTLIIRRNMVKSDEIYRQKPITSKTMDFLKN